MTALVKILTYRLLSILTFSSVDCFGPDGEACSKIDRSGHSSKLPSEAGLLCQSELQKHCCCTKGPRLCRLHEQQQDAGAI